VPHIITVAATAVDIDPFTFSDESDALAARFAAVVAPAPATPPARCLGCGRALRSAKSLAAGMGPTCLRNARRRASLLDGSFSDRQVEAAVEAVEDGAVVPAAVAGVFYVVGSKGDKVYETTAAGTCTCRAFVDGGRLCWHAAAVALVAPSALAVAA